MSTSNEKRQSQRYVLHRGSVASINGTQTYSTVIDISENGLAFICAPELQHGDKIEIALELKEEGNTKTFSVIVEVVRCLQEDFEYQIGAIVKTITHEFKTLVEQIKRARMNYQAAV